VFLKVTPEQYAKLKRKQYFDRIFLRNSRSSGFDLSGEPKKPHNMDAQLLAVATLEVVVSHTLDTARLA